ncbi:MAG TPA: class I adenylate-forming enzyme family protein [Burkholderiales bacterium]|nr:class I adenylate-forming enzyme family protein [Burkholderiales bacterium]
MGVPEQLLVGDVLRYAALRTPRAPAASLGDRQITFEAAALKAERLAASLYKVGVRHGDRVAWWAETSLEAMPLYFALAQLGAVFVPLNPRYTEDECRQVLNKADPRLVLTDDGRGGHAKLSDLTDAGKAPPVNVAETDPFILFFTSGTTGEPKGCILSHRTERLRAGIGSPFPLGATVCMFPQFHMAGWAFALRAWISGDQMVYVEKPDAHELLGAVTRHRAYEMYCIPAVWQRILETDRSGYDLSSLRLANTGTSATTPELLTAIAEAFPKAATCIAYGSTEAHAVCMLGPKDILRKPNSVGPAAAGVRLKLDEAGELWVRSPYLFSGYFRNEEATSAALVDGWYRTGDLAERDDEGYYSIVGRAKDIIRTGGETVAPVEVDLVLQSHPAVLDGAVRGAPDERWGEVIEAFVVLRQGSTLTIEALRDYCAGRLAPHKHPRRLFIVQSIPRTGSTGQVQRRLLVP